MNFMVKTRGMRDLLRESLRSLRRDLKLTVFAAALLAVTIGGITGVYAIVQAVVLRPLPVADQDRVVIMWQRDDRRAVPLVEVAYNDMLDWRARSRSLDELAVLGTTNWFLGLVGTTDVQTIEMSGVSASFFRVVGTLPVLGRALEAADDNGPAPRAMVISHGLWQRRFGARADVLNAPIHIKLNADAPSLPIQIVGVMPREFDFPRGVDAWLPAAPLVRTFSAAFPGDGDALAGLGVFYALGKMKPGVRVGDATTELTQVMRTAEKTSGFDPMERMVVTPLQSYLLGPAAPVLWTLLGGTVLMLGIACANVAAMQVARAARRTRAMAVRLAIGASPGRLVRQVVTETACLAVLAGALSVVVAHAVIGVLVAAAPEGVPHLATASLLDPRVALLCIAAAFVSMCVAAAWPALLARRLDAASVLAHGADSGASPRARRVQRALVIAQMAVAITLLAGTGLFVETVRGLDRTALGFDPRGLVAVNVSSGTEDLAKTNMFYDGLITRVRALPGVASAAAVAIRPLAGPIGWDGQPIYPGQDPERPATFSLNPYMNTEVVTPGYFETMGIRLTRGRLFSEMDTLTSPGAVIVSENAARRLWPGKDPIGQRLRESSYRSDVKAPFIRWQTVVGVVADVRYRGLNDTRLDLYVPHTQTTDQVHDLMVRSSGAPADVIAAVRAAAKAIDPKSIVGDAAVMTDVVAKESAPWRFLMRVFIAFAGLAATLAIVGLAAVVSLSVSARMRELAIRAALGATGARLRLAIVRETVWTAGLGLVFGSIGAWLLGRAVAGVLIGVRPDDVVVLSSAGVSMALAGLAASWVAARRATQANPLDLMRVG